MVIIKILHKFTVESNYLKLTVDSLLPLPLVTIFILPAGAQISADRVVADLHAAHVTVGTGLDVERVERGKIVLHRHRT